MFWVVVKRRPQGKKSGCVRFSASAPWIGLLCLSVRPPPSLPFLRLATQPTPSTQQHPVGRDLLRAVSDRKKPLNLLVVTSLRTDHQGNHHLIQPFNHTHPARRRPISSIEASYTTNRYRPSSIGAIYNSGRHDFHRHTTPPLSA